MFSLFLRIFRFFLKKSPFCSNFLRHFCNFKEFLRIFRIFYDLSVFSENSNFYGIYPIGPIFFHEFYPKKFNYKTIIFGLEPSLYESVGPFKDRISNKILNSGAIGNLSLYSKMINKFKKPVDGNPFYGYRLRTLCTQLPYVDYTSTLAHEYIGDKYPK